MSHVSLDYRMHEKDSASMQPKLKENLLMFIVDFVALAEQWHCKVMLLSCVDLWANIW